MGNQPSSENSLLVGPAMAIGKNLDRPNAEFNPILLWDWDPTSVAGVSSSCIETFSAGKMGIDYSSFPLRLAALLYNAEIDEDLREEGFTEVTNFGCKFNSEEKSVHCDFATLFDRILEECKILDVRGFAETSTKHFIEGDCEKILGIPRSVSKHKQFNPEKDWCPTYYGKEGSATFATVEMTRSYDELIYWNYPRGISGNIFIVDNVPYCTAFDSCTEDDFFRMANEEASAYVDAYYPEEENYEVKITQTNESRISKKDAAKAAKIPKARKALRAKN